MDQVSSNTAPVLSDSLSRNQPYSTSLSVTVSGLNFNTVDGTPSAQIALGSCSTAAWTSGTSVLCFQTASGSPDDVSVVATVSSDVGTSSLVFSFDGAALFRSLCSANSLWVTLPPRNKFRSAYCQRPINSDECCQLAIEQHTLRRRHEFSVY